MLIPFSFASKLEQFNRPLSLNIGSISQEAILICVTVKLIKMMENVIGFDISKRTLDYAYQNTSGVWVTKKIEYSLKAINQLIKELPKECICVMEATGPYYIKLASVLYESNIQVSVINPLIIKHYSRMKMNRTKTDKADAILIAQYGKEQQPSLWKPDEKTISLLRDKTSTQEFFIKQRTAFKNKLESLSQHSEVDKNSKKYIRQEIKTIETKITKLDKEVDDLIIQNYKNQFTLLRSIPGIGPKSAVTLIAITGGFKKFSNYKKLTSYIGLCPRIYESGSSVRGKSPICKMGMKRMRQLLYMAALTAKVNNKTCSDLYDRLIAKGKPKKLALIAIANKLVRQAFGVINNNLPYCVFS